MSPWLAGGIGFAAGLVICFALLAWYLEGVMKY